MKTLRPGRTNCVKYRPIGSPNSGRTSDHIWKKKLGPAASAPCFRLWLMLGEDRLYCTLSARVHCLKYQNIYRVSKPTGPTICLVPDSEPVLATPAALPHAHHLLKLDLDLPVNFSHLKKNLPCRERTKRETVNKREVREGEDGATSSRSDRSAGAASCKEINRSRPCSHGDGGTTVMES